METIPKYEFKSLGDDFYSLNYTNNEGETITKQFKLTIKTLRKIESVTAKARLRMSKDMKDMGITRDDLVIKIDDGKGHIKEDETEFNRLEQSYIGQEQMSAIGDILDDCFKMSYEELLMDMGADKITNEQQATDFAAKFIQDFMSLADKKTPRDRAK